MSYGICHIWTLKNIISQGHTCSARLVIALCLQMSIDFCSPVFLGLA